MTVSPYYEDESCVIYHADCRDVLPHLARVDLVLTDPPYGIGRDGMRASTSSHGGRKAYEFLGWDAAPPDGELMRAVLNAGRHQIIWGGNYFTRELPPSMGWLVWDKDQRIQSSDAELAFTSFDKALRVYNRNRVILMMEGAYHPTQKPVTLMIWCIRQAPEDCYTILDPFMGSGTTLVAAKQLGRRAIGIEIEKRYVDIAVERLRQDVLPLAEPAPPAAVQETLAL